MRANDIVATCCVGLVVLGAVVMSTRSEGSSQVQTDYRDIAAQLVQRGEISTEGSVSFRQYKFVTQGDNFDDLVAMLLDSQTSPVADVRDTAETWLAEHMPAAREAWIGGCSYRAGRWRSHRQRMPESDTAFATVTTQANAANMQAAPILRGVVTHVDGEVLTVVEDGRAVFRSARTGHRHPAVPMDISLASWQEAIDLGANIEGQEIVGSSDGAKHSMLYVNTAPDGTWGAADYVFREDLDWAPSELRSFDAAGTDARIVYGYDLSVTVPITRPAVVAQGELLESGELDVVVWVIDSWVESCSPSEVTLRLPPIHLEIDYLQSPNAPLVAMREPDYLVDIESCDKAVVAIVNVAISIGSEAQETDFDCDGYVTLSDVDSALQTFSGAGQVP